MLGKPILFALPLAAMTLSACEMATDLAGDAIADEIRTQYVAQCEQIATDNGLAMEIVTPACECSADKFATDAADGEIDINRDRIVEVLKTCVQDQSEDPADIPAEATNG